MTEDAKDIVALLRLLEYLRGEAQRLGLFDAAPLLDLTMRSLFREIPSRFGAHVLEAGWQPS